MHTVEEPLWFGPSEGPLVGWLTRPADALVRGGVVLAPPIGREARAARRAIRYLAISLAQHGFVTLRFDYQGTGDSSGAFEGPLRDRAWVQSVVEAVKLLRSLGVTSIAAVGMRLGATLLGQASADHDLALSSLVLWDPCESGRSYLRELGALEALRRNDVQFDTNAPIETSEFVFTQQAADDLRRLNLANLGPGPLADRVLVVSRDDRPISKKLSERLDQEDIKWETTSEQVSLLDIDPLDAVMPEKTMDRITSWLLEPNDPTQPFGLTDLATTATVFNGRKGDAVREYFVQLGPRQLFGVVSEPTNEVKGPLIVFINVSNEEHTGPARLWVELSRRWASHGLRCLRFDLSGLGDSPWLPRQPAHPLYDQDWLTDIPDAVNAVSPADPSNVILIGLCSGAYLAAEGALILKARGACAINPPVGNDLLHAISVMETSRRKLVRALAVQLKVPALRIRWLTAGLFDVCRKVLPSAYKVDLMATVVKNGTDLMVLASLQDLSPFPRVPLLRSIDRSRVVAPKNYVAEFVPELDHSMHVVEGRNRAVALLDRHVLEDFAGVSPRDDLGTPTTEGS